MKSKIILRIIYIYFDIYKTSLESHNDDITLCNVVNNLLISYRLKKSLNILLYTSLTFLKHFISKSYANILNYEFTIPPLSNC